MTPSAPHTARADHTIDHAVGRLLYRMRRDFRDLRRLTGFDDARSSVAEIINSEAERAGRYDNVADRS